MAEGVSYSFPLLTSKKIVGYLSDLQIHVSEEVMTAFYSVEFVGSIVRDADDLWVVDNPWPRREVLSVGSVRCTCHCDVAPGTTVVVCFCFTGVTWGLGHSISSATTTLVLLYCCTAVVPPLTNSNKAGYALF